MGDQVLQITENSKTFQISFNQIDRYEKFKKYQNQHFTATAKQIIRDIMGYHIYHHIYYSGISHNEYLVALCMETLAHKVVKWPELGENQ